jgi:hypothetical protein
MCLQGRFGDGVWWCWSPPVVSGWWVAAWWAGRWLSGGAVAWHSNGQWPDGCVGWWPRVPVGWWSGGGAAQEATGWWPSRVAVLQASGPGLGGPVAWRPCGQWLGCSFSKLLHGEAFHMLMVHIAEVSALPQPSMSPVSQKCPWFMELMQSASLSHLPSWIF